MKSMHHPRASASSTILNKYICIAGGLGNSSVELYDPQTDEWTKVTPMNTARCGFALIAWNGFLYAMGDDAVVERFDPYKNCWSMVCELNGDW